MSAKAAGVPLIEIDELAEMDHGYMAGLVAEQAELRFPGQLTMRESNKYTWRFPGGESYADVEHRANAALGILASLSTRRVLVVSHEMIGRMLLHALSATSLAAALRSRQPHDIVYQISAVGGEAERISLATSA